MRTQLWAIALAMVATLLGAFAALLLKLGVKGFEFQKGAVAVAKISAALLLYVVAIFLFFFALKGGQLSVLTPIDSLTYIWTTLLSYYFLNERITARKVAGVALIVFGVVIVTASK
ncbi:MAG: EamA family transporter [Bacteroidetes bacterium]|nr:EamA family transporter [Bacteroidota bacterium]